MRGFLPPLQGWKTDRRALHRPASVEPQMLQVRPMTTDDVDAVIGVVRTSATAADLAKGHESPDLTETQLSNFRKGMQRFVQVDPLGAWVAVDGDVVIGMAEAIRRDDFWGLSMLFVDPNRQNSGVGRSLIDAALTYAEGAAVRMILTSPDPRALRRYSLAGLAIHPSVDAEGSVDRGAIPSDLPGRPGGVDDLDLVAHVDAGLRGSRADDIAFILTVGGRMEVIDAVRGRGYVVHREGRLLCLGATDDTTAAQLLWRFCAEAGEKAEVWALTAAQDWAVKVALAARLTVVPAGPLFIDGLASPPGPWIPSGWYF